jgi:hypothetical protein
MYLCGTEMFHAHFNVICFQDLKVSNFLRQKLPLAMKSYSVYWKMLISIT